MSSVIIITIIIVLLAALVCYAFVSQTIQHKKQQRERLILALQRRVRNFKFMLSGFPPGFLPKSLRLLVQRSLLDVLEQLTRLEPKNAHHAQDMQTLTQQMSETQREGETDASSTMENPQQIREVKACLEELHKFIFQLEDRRGLPRNQADAYRGMIRQLVLQISTDSYILHGRQAKMKGKALLAVHYFSLALKLLIREGADGRFDKKIQQLKAVIADLEQGLGEEAPRPGLSDEEQAEKAELDDAWDKFGEETAGWKKKQIYD